MITIGVVDDGVGIFPTLYKLKQVVPANYVGLLADKDLSLLNKGALISLAKEYLALLQKRGCDAVVFSSIDLSCASYKALSSNADYPLFGSEPPINHAATYTISNVLVVGGQNVKYVRQPNVIPCVLAEFPALAREGNYKKIVDYVTQKTAPFDGAFDCIALSHSSMNMYKSCFSRVYPNVQIFDSLEGIARRLRKKYKKLSKEEGELVLIDQAGKDISAEYGEFLQ